MFNGNLQQRNRLMKEFFVMLIYVLGLILSPGYFYYQSDIQYMQPNKDRGTVTLYATMFWPVVVPGLIIYDVGAWTFNQWKPKE